MKRIFCGERTISCLPIFTASPMVPAKAENMPGVPVKVTEFVEDTEFRRLTLAETYGQILEDLSEAERCLDGKRRASIYHANQTAALLLKSRVYLYMQNLGKKLLNMPEWHWTGRARCLTCIRKLRVRIAFIRTRPKRYSAWGIT